MLSHPHPFLDPHAQCHGVSPLKMVSANLLPPMSSSAMGGLPKPGGKFSIRSNADSLPGLTAAVTGGPQGQWSPKDGLQRHSRASNSLLPSSPNTDSPKGYSQKLKCPL